MFGWSPTLPATTGLKRFWSSGSFLPKPGPITRNRRRAGPSDNDHYTTTLAYDPAGNVASKTQQVYLSSLNSRGNRLYVSDSRGARPDNYHGRTKRYNAEGRAAEFHILQSNDAYLFGKPAGKTSIYTDFRYDPFGNQVMSSNGWTWEEDGYNQAQHAMYRETYTNVVVGGDVQAIRRQWGEMAKYWHWAGWYSCGWQWECRSDWNANNAYKDEAYSLADGALEGRWTAVTPFNASPLFAKAPTNLALPAAALSSQLRLSVGNVSLLDLRPPAANPSNSGNGNGPSLTPPAQVTQGQPQGQQGQPQTFGLSGSASLTLTLLGGGGSNPDLDPAGVALPGLGGRGGQAGAEDAARFGLSLPTGVLPPVLQALNTLDLRAPAPQDNPGAGSGLTPPGGGVAPPIPIGGVPAPLDTVAPPLGWGQPPRPGETVSPFEVTTDGDSGNPTDNDEEKRKREEEQRRALEAKIRKEQEEARERAEAVCNRYGGGTGASCADYLRRQGESSFYESLSPEQRLHWWQTINKKLSEGSMGKKDLEVLTRFTESFSLGKGSNGLPVLNASNPGKLDPALLGLAAGLGIPLGNVPPGMQAGPRLPQNPGLQPPNLNLGPLITTVARVGTIIGIIISLPGDTPQGQPTGMQAGNVNVPDVYTSGRIGIPERPQGATNETLNNVLDDLYQETDRYPGGTAGAVRRELATGEGVGGTFHTEKAEQYSKALWKLINSGKLNERDQEIAWSVYKDLQKALKGK